jgi:hypothetical protein
VKRSTSSTRRHPRATGKRPKSEFAGPLREVVYIFERTGTCGGAIWWLVLECGHAVARKQAKTWSAQVRSMFQPLEEKIAPKRCQCHSCGSGVATQDPALLVMTFGGPKI